MTGETQRTRWTTAAAVAAGTGLWWAAFLAAGSAAATVGMALSFVGLAHRLVSLFRSERARRGWPGWVQAACARAAFPLGLCVGIFSAALLAWQFLRSATHRAAEDSMELAVIHLAFVGPLFLAGVVCACLARPRAAAPAALLALYPLSWVVLLGPELVAT